MTSVVVGKQARRPMDDESRAWVTRLRGADPVRGEAIGELHERLRREALFQLRARTRHRASFPRSDLEDLAVQAADDALLAVLRKLDDYRGDSQFWTWARRFAQLEAPVSIRRRLGHDCLPPDDPARGPQLYDPAGSLQDRAEIRELLRVISGVSVNQLTERQRTVLVAVAINGSSTDALAAELGTSRGAIHKALHDARAKLRAHVALG